MGFKTQEKIWKHLLNGGMVKSKISDKIYSLKNGFIVDKNGARKLHAFDSPENWIVHKIPLKYELESFYQENWEYSSIKIPTKFKGKNVKIIIEEI